MELALKSFEKSREQNRHERLTGFAAAMVAELARARAKHQTPIHNAHEAYGVIYEELDEFWDEVRAQKHDPAKMLKELIQTAAMCMRAAEDLGFIQAGEEHDETEVERQLRSARPSLAPIKGENQR